MAKLSLHVSEKERQKESKENKRFSTSQKGWGKGFAEKPVFVKRMMLPHFWSAWFALFMLFVIVNVLPYRVQMFLGSKIGRLMGTILPARKYVLKRNLELAFPEMSDEERHNLSKEIQRNSGMAIFETGMAWFWPDWRLKRHVIIDEEGMQYAKECTASGKPVLVLTAHFVHLELMARIYGTYIKSGIGVYRPTDHPVWEWAQVKGRLRKNLALVSKNDPRSMIKALKTGAPIWYAPDQDYGRRVSVFAPFFAVKDTATVAATHNLAKIEGTMITPSWTIREGDKYQKKKKKALQDFPTEDTIADATTVNKVIENMVRMAPEQYLWMHRRFKTAPDENENRYPGLEE